ncbi:MAG: hypothetical protein E7680_05995 [Ruminococcaceae bacterium]|nr:hypothetical protein [Oscillospiraceae bacterium]
MNKEQNEMQSVNETGAVGGEFSSYSEFDNQVPSTLTVSEQSDTREFFTDGGPSKKKKENKNAAFFHKMLVSATVAVAAIVTAETVGIVGFSDVTVRDAYIETSENAVWYSMELDGYTDGAEELAVEIYNDFEHRREPVQLEREHDSQNEDENPEKQRRLFAFGEVRDLKPDIDYTFEVFYGSWTIYKQKIRTAKQEEPWQDEPHENPDTADPTMAAFDYQSFESMIFYSFSVSNFLQNDYFVVRLLQGGRLFTQNDVEDISAEEPYISGEFYNLMPDTEYTVQLVKNPESDVEQIVIEQIVWTLSWEESIPEPEFTSTEDSIFYSIPISEFGENDFFMLLLFENGDAFQEGGTSDLSMENPYLVGEFHDLQSGTEYEIRLLRNQEEILSFFITTQGVKEQFPETDNEYFSIIDGMIYYSIPIDGILIEPDMPLNFEVSMFTETDESIEDMEPIGWSYPEFYPDEDGNAFVTGFFEDITISESGIYAVKLEMNVYNDWETIGIYRYQISESDFEKLDWQY